MAPWTGTIITCMLLFTTMMGCSEPKQRTIKETKMIFHMHDWESGKNFMAVPVAGINGRFANVLNFTTVSVIDDALTEGMDRDSKEVGRAQGIYVNSALDGCNLHMIFSAVFTDGKYKGSTLEFQGADRRNLKYREVSVVSGTGVFRYGRGYATLETVFLEPPGYNAIIRFNATVRHA